MSDGIDFGPLHSKLFNVFGVDGSVVRGTDAAVPVRVVVNRSVETLGDYGKVTGRITTVDFQSAQWLPKQGDVLTIGSDVRKVDKLHGDDGYVATAVMHA